MSPTATLVCPKCMGSMRTYERSGVMVDQCTECRGVFLDRGELERLLDAEAGGLGASDTGTRTAGTDPDLRRWEQGHDAEDDHDRDDERRGGSPQSRPSDPRDRRRESRFGGILDLFGGD